MILGQTRQQTGERNRVINTRNGLHWENVFECSTAAKTSYLLDMSFEFDD